MNRHRLLRRVLSGAKNISFDDMFDDMADLVEAFGFTLSRISGSHHIFVHPDIPELVNLQSVKNQAKPYQIKQFLRLVERYDLKLED